MSDTPIKDSLLTERRQRSSPPDREPYAWLALAAALTLVAFVLSFAFDAAVGLGFALAALACAAYRKATDA